MPRLAGLWRHPDFVRLWTGQTVSVFGSLVGGTALDFTAILVLRATPIELALLRAAKLVPGFAAGPIAGVWVDRLPRRPLLVGADLGRALLLASIPLAAVLGRLGVGQLCLVAAAVGVLTTLFDVAYRSYLPSLIRREDLVEGNGKLSASNSVAEVAGFGVAGWLVQILTAPIAVLVDAASFLVSAGSLLTIGGQERVSRDRGTRQGLTREIAVGLRTVAADPILRVLAGASLALGLASGLIGTVILLYLSRDLGFAPGILGTVFAVGGASALLGALAVGPVTARLGIGRAMIGGLAISGIATFLIPLATDASLVSLALLVGQQLLGDGARTVFEIDEVSVRQAIAPEDVLGRVNASLEFAGLGATLIGTALGGLLGEAGDLRTVLFLGAAITVLTAVGLALSPLRAMRLELAA